MLKSLQVIKKITSETNRSESPLEIVEAVVVSDPPDLKIKVKDNDKLIIPAEIIQVSEHLTRHIRTADISGTVIASSMTANGTGPHKHEITSVSLEGADVEFTDELKIGDQVMVAILQGGQSFFIFDRVTSYGE